MQTFENEISFLSKEFVDEKFEFVVTKRLATFKELDATDRDQHKLHFKVPDFFSKMKFEESENSNKVDGDDADKQKVVFDTDRTYEMAVLFIEKMLVVNDKVTATDKVEFLNDSIAIWQFGRWLIPNKIIPFFYLFNDRQKQ